MTLDSFDPANTLAPTFSRADGRAGSVRPLSTDLLYFDSDIWRISKYKKILLEGSFSAASKPTFVSKGFKLSDSEMLRLTK